MWDIFVSKLSFSAEPVIGVGLIAVYFCWMMYMAVKRIKAGEHLH